MNYKDQYKDWQKRREYLTRKAREYYHKKYGYKRLTTEQIFGSEGHCPTCGMRLEADFHIKFPCKK